MNFTVDIEITDTQGYSALELSEGIHARLHPVVSCHPDEVVSSKVAVHFVADGKVPTDYNERVSQLLASNHLRQKAERLHVLLVAANGTRFDRTLDQIVHDLAMSILALEVHPTTPYATAGGFIVVRGPMDGYSVHVTAADIFTIQMEMEQMHG